MKYATLAIASLSLVVSSATLAVLLLGAKRAQSEIEQVRTKTNTALGKIRAGLADLGDL